MSVSYCIDVAQRSILSRAMGYLTAPELWQHQQQLQHDPAFVSTFCELWDGTAVTTVTVTGAGIRQLAMVSVFEPGMPRAMVAPQDVIYGLARMFQTLRGLQGGQIAVFREVEAACAWLEEGRVRPWNRELVTGGGERRKRGPGGAAAPGACRVQGESACLPAGDGIGYSPGRQRDQPRGVWQCEHIRQGQHNYKFGH